MAGPLQDAEQRGMYRKSLSEMEGYITQFEGFDSDDESIATEKEYASVVAPVAQQPEYRLDWANDSVFIDADEPDEEPSIQVDRHLDPPHDDGMVEMILMEDLDFFQAVLQGRDPPSATRRVRDFIDEEQRAKQRSHEKRIAEANLRRIEESKEMQVDMDFYLTLMQKD